LEPVYNALHLVPRQRCEWLGTNYHVGDSVHIARGPVTQERKYFGVQHFVIQPTIVKGNSGGPVLDKANRVVGIAVKGLGTPGRFSEFDELSSFVPVTMLKELK